MSGLVVTTEASARLFTDICTYSVHAVKGFDAEKELAEGKHGIGGTSPEFRQMIADMGKTDAPSAKLRVRKSLKSLTDDKIIIELGGDESAETFLAWLPGLLRKLPHGRYVFYVKDTYGKLWVVDGGWYSSCDGWLLDVHSVSYSCPWGTGVQFVSCDSVAR